MKRIRGDKPVGVITHIYMEMSQGNSLYSCLYPKLSHVFHFVFSLFSSTKSGNRKTEQVLAREEGWRHGRERC
jgi:hypothetical protein